MEAQRKERSAFLKESLTFLSTIMIKRSMLTLMVLEMYYCGMT